mmetsp:Transcript_5207/g.14732  ORF Transcript_5207/g.14732 Transcript_5207/m.14732 type:complete len:313 (+) Transcript_5207:153-1091(+)
MPLSAPHHDERQQLGSNEEEPCARHGHAAAHEQGLARRHVVPRRLRHRLQLRERRQAALGEGAWPPSAGGVAAAGHIDEEGPDLDGEGAADGVGVAPVVLAGLLQLALERPLEGEPGEDRLDGAGALELGGLEEVHVVLGVGVRVVHGAARDRKRLLEDRDEVHLDWRSFGHDLPLQGCPEVQVGGVAAERDAHGDAVERALLQRVVVHCGARAAEGCGHRLVGEADGVIVARYRQVVVRRGEVRLLELLRKLLHDHVLRGSGQHRIRGWATKPTKPHSRRWHRASFLRDQHEHHQRRLAANCLPRTQAKLA